MEELGGLPTPDLEQCVRDCKEELFNLRFQKKLNKLEDTSRIRRVRIRMARCKTLLRARELTMEGGGGFDQGKSSSS
ncbi:50S ribosomal protein L29 [Pasteuria penetrans]|uniref:50S ribosomal protein L29 n=1 Tax=Pasteuria penetrans TaxID=86005 RepID=UPI0011EC45F8|nr:50S ribosomal protein L29 [Pasteuria penetrans]